MYKKFALSFCISISLSSNAQVFGLDPTFGDNGVRIHALGSINDEIRAMAIQQDGKIVAAGLSYADLPAMICGVSRYTTNGSLDNTFNGVGFETDNFGQLSCSWHAVALQNDEKIVVAGTARDTISFEDNFGLGRYNADGTIDNTFGINGKVITDFFNSQDHARSVVIQNDGKILAAGTTADPQLHSLMAIARYNSDGTLDPSFSNDGKLSIDFGMSSSCTSMKQLPDGKFLLSGFVAITNSLSNIALVRVNEDGTVDETFGDQGLKIISTNYSLSGESMVINEEGKIIIAGYAVIPPPYYDFAVLRLLPDGEPDLSFSGDGIETTAFGEFMDYGHSVVLQQDGKIIVGGSSSASGLQNDMALARYDINGVLDDTFGTAGKLVVPVSTGYESIYSMRMLEDGKLVAAGFSELSGQRQFTVMRFTPNLPIGIAEPLHFVRDAFVYPNPVNRLTTISYSLDADEIVSLDLVDLQGRVIKSLIHYQHQNAGFHQILLDINEELKSGEYFIRLYNHNNMVSVKLVKP